jgi:hypothetical protein
VKWFLIEARRSLHSGIGIVSIRGMVGCFRCDSTDPNVFNLLKWKQYSGYSCLRVSESTGRTILCAWDALANRRVGSVIPQGGLVLRGAERSDVGPISTGQGNGNLRGIDPKELRQEVQSMWQRGTIGC